MAIRRQIFMAQNPPHKFARRKFLRDVVLGASALAAFPILGCRSFSPQKQRGGACWEFSLDNNWLFGGGNPDIATQSVFNDSAFKNVSLPHCVTRLSWQNWKFSDWSGIGVYRRHFSLPENTRDHRVFLHFDGVVSGATPFINGQPLPQHIGGYLPFAYEITDRLVQDENTLAVAVDSRWVNAPPEGSPRGVGAVDFFEPGGITRGVSLRVVPQIFISNVFIKPVNVMDANRRIDVTCKLDAAIALPKSASVKVELLDGGRTIAETSQTLQIEQPGVTEVKLTLDTLGNVKLWDIHIPQLYHVIVTLSLDGKPVHDYRSSTGLRDARFELDGFYLNGERLQLFGLNRHELFPYTGFAMPPRVMRRDAEILRRELNCNIVRCSHYPQSESFLDACDELGLLVWEEIPGWSYVGNAAWQDLLVRDVQDMVVRDRNHPAIVIWGVRVNESNDNPELYRRTTATAKALDDSRPVSGAMVGGGGERHSTKHWAEDVFAYNDYHQTAPDYRISLQPPLPGVPYLITETVGQIVGPPKVDHRYRRAGDPFLQARQAIYHAQAHDQVLADKRYAGVIAWCAFEYGSPINSFKGVKYPGVVDFFRIPKLGAAFYQSQVDPMIKPVIQPNFYWDFGRQTPRGPGKNSAIFSNSERLKFFLDGKEIAELEPDRHKFPHLKYPPFFIDLDLAGAGHPELRIDGFAGDKLILSRSFSSDPTQDQFLLRADDTEILGDGIDSTRLVFGVVDKFGAPRAFAGGEVYFQIEGAAEIIGDNPFQLTDAGGLAALWIKSVQNNPGRVKITGTHTFLGEKFIEILSTKPTG